MECVDFWSGFSLISASSFTLRRLIIRFLTLIGLKCLLGLLFSISRLTQLRPTTLIRCFLADSLHYTSAAAFGLAVVFVVILIIVTLIRLAEGSIGFPQMLPAFETPHDWLQLCSVVPVMANAFVCHFNGEPARLECCLHRFDGT